MTPRTGARSHKNQTSLLIGVIVVVVIATGAALFVAKHRKAADLTVKPSTSPTPTVQGPAKTGSAPAGPEAAGATPTATPTTISNPSHPAGEPLAAPTLIENSSTVSLSGATGMESTCQSVPGASCYIQASMGGTTKTVSQSETVPDSGADGVILNWDASQAGLTAGSWAIEAIATLNGQTAASSPQTLTVTN